MRRLDNLPPASTKWSKEEKEEYREQRRREREQASGNSRAPASGCPVAEIRLCWRVVTRPMTTEELQLKPPLWVQAHAPPPTGRRGPVVYERQMDGRWVRQAPARSARPDLERPAQPVSYYNAARQRLEIGRQQRQLWSKEHQTNLEEMRSLRQQKLHETRILAAARRATRLSPREASVLRREQQHQLNSARRAESGGRDWQAMQIASQKLQELELKQKQLAVRDVAMTLRAADSAVARSSRAVIYSEQKAKGFVLPPVYSPRKTAILWSDHQ